MARLTEAQALLAVVEASLKWANFSAGEGICAAPDTGVVAPEDFLMDYSYETGDEDWETAPERITARLAALLSERAKGEADA